MKSEEFERRLLTPGHRACSGCGEILAVRTVLNAAGSNSIAASCTGCIEVVTSPYPESSWGIPWIHSLFENGPSVAAGIEAGLKALGKTEVNVLSLGGDGGTFDIGFGALSGALERQHNVLFVCFDNEAYMNTGIQRSGATPFDARTTTSPPGKMSWGKDIGKKDMPAICAAHNIPFSSTASIGYPNDVRRKVKKALSIEGPKYLQILVPCTPGWYIQDSKTPTVAKLAVETAIYPILTYEFNELTQVKKIKDRKPVEEYLKLQGRFSHLFRSEEGLGEIEKIQKIADENARKYSLDM